MASTYTTGVNYVLFAEDAEGELTRIAGQTEATLEMSGNLSSITNKDDAGWSSDIPTTKSWSISTSSLLALGEAGHEILEDSFMNSEKVKIQLQTPSLTSWEGYVYIDSLSYELGVEGVATYSATLTGQGALQRLPKV